MHYYPHHIGDFIRDTARLSDAQSMAYLRLLWSYYDTETPLPDDPKRLAFQVGSTPDDVSLILQHYFFLENGLWRHTRCDAEISEFRSKKEKAKNSANARWKNASAMRTHNERNADAPKNDANQEPRTKNQERETDAGKPAPSPTRLITFKTFVDQCKSESRKPIPDDHYIREFCQTAGISNDMLALNWLRFREEHLTGTRSGKKYKDWPGVFANSVKDRWYRLWLVNNEGDATWTNEGLQAKRVAEAEAA